MTGVVHLILLLGVFLLTLFIIWMSARANGITIWEYFRLYGGELLILLIVTTVLIILVIGDII